MTFDPIHPWQTMTTVEAEALRRQDPVVILPVAAIEQHGPHLPLSTDLEIGLGLLAEAFTQLGDEVPTWTLPAQSIGTSAEHLGFAGTLSLTPEIFAETIFQLGSAIALSGIRRLLVFNSHGGNIPAIETASLRLRKEHGLLVVKTSYFQFPHPDDTGIPGSEWDYGLHGGTVETAMMLHLRPNLVRTEALQRFPSFGEELNQATEHIGPAKAASFAWLAKDLNPQGVVGDATLAEPKLGAYLVSHYGQALARVIEGTKAFPMDRLL